MSDQTCENRVGESLVNYLHVQPGITVLSYHPTSAKAYQSEIIRIPKRARDGVRTRDRYHVDIIFVSGNELWLTELKCYLSESAGDVDKLQDIMTSYSLAELIGLITNRLTSVQPTVLETVGEVIPALGVEVVDDDLPPGFVVFQVKDGKVTVYENGVATPVKQ